MQEDQGLFQMIMNSTIQIQPMTMSIAYTTEEDQDLIRMTIVLITLNQLLFIVLYKLSILRFTDNAWLYLSRSKYEILIEEDVKCIERNFSQIIAFYIISDGF